MESLPIKLQTYFGEKVVSQCHKSPDFPSQVASGNETRKQVKVNRDGSLGFLTPRRGDARYNGARGEGSSGSGGGRANEHPAWSGL